MPAVRSAFLSVASAAEHVRQDPEGGPLAVSVTPFFAHTWLVPRLGAFRDRHPGIDLHVMANTTISNLEAGEADLAIRHGPGRYPGMTSDLILALNVVPVVAPEMIERLGVPAGAAALVEWPKIHDHDRGGWALWFQHAGLTDCGTLRGPSFDDVGLLRAAVIAGQGAGLLPAELVEDDVAAGHLVRLADTALLETFAYYLVAPTWALGKRNVAASVPGCWIRSPLRNRHAEFHLTCVVYMLCYL